MNNNFIKNKIILHIDLNAFFCQCEINKNSFLKTVPFLIGNDFNIGHGICLTANYLARKFNIKSGLSIYQCQKLCPYVRIVPPDYKLYKYYSSLFFNELKKYSKIILKYSIDECFLDITDIVNDNNIYEFAKQIQTNLLTKYNLPTSIGISNTMFLAKMASDFKKPLGITIIKSNNLDILDNLCVKDIFNVGNKTSKLLINNGIETIEDFKKIPNQDKIINLIGNNRYHYIINNLLGKGENNLKKYIFKESKQISKEYSFNYTIYDKYNIDQILPSLLKGILNEVMIINEIPSTFFVKYKDNNFNQHTKQIRLDENFMLGVDNLISCFYNLIGEDIINEGVRLIGVGFIKKRINKNVEEINLFNYTDKCISNFRKLNNVIESINKKYNDIIVKIIDE